MEWQLSRYLLNLLGGVLPPTRLFALKAYIYGVAGVALGDDVKIGSNCTILGNGCLSIGARTWVGVGTRFVVPYGARIVIGSNCDIAPGVSFLCGTHKLGNANRRAGEGYFEDIEIGSGVWIGASVLILPGVKIGNGSVVGAGSVVLSGEYPESALIAGNPAVVKKLYEN